jgi:putative DNA primase/helicase
MIEAIEQFREAIRSAGLEPPKLIKVGKLHRFPGVDKRNGNTAGWCKLFDDGMGGCFGDWSSGYSATWQAKRGKPLGLEERQAFQFHIAEAQVQIETERKTRQAEAATKANAIWNAAAPAPDDHPYLARKNVNAHGIRVHKGRLITPMCRSGQLHSLQFVRADGSKRFLADGRVAGCHHQIGSPEGAQALCIAEGYATAATIHETTDYPVAIAFNAGNLMPVTKAIHERFPNLPLILCADDDIATEGNPGLTKAIAAARCVDGMLAVPDFGTDRPNGASDFNDLAALRGLEAVSRSIQTATALGLGEQDQIELSAPVGHQWPHPLPLTAAVDPEPYPLDALPDIVRAAVEEVQGFAKAPVPLVASSGLSALSLAIQGHIDVKRAEKLSGPVSLFLLTIADSGERKSTCDSFFMAAIREYERACEEAAKPERARYAADHSAWAAEREGILQAIKQAGRSGRETADHKARLAKCEEMRPAPSRLPRLLRGDETPESLAWVLSHEWPFGGVVSAEAGIVFGAHSMGKDSITRNLALLNILWDGGVLSIGRRTSESFTVRGARLTVALQVQEATLRNFFERSSGLARGTGFLSRFLVAWPESTQGFRSFTEPPRHWSALTEFNQRIAAILNKSTRIDEGGALSPPMLPLASEAKAAWVAFHDAIERELRTGGELYDVRDVASKTADNAARLAALFQVFAQGTSSGAVGMNAFEGASRIAAWHLHEARRFFGELALPTELADAARLDRWLVDYCSRYQTFIAPRREVQRNVTPTHLRQKASLDNALRELTESSRVRLVHEDRRKEIHLNPALVDGSAA